MCITIGHLVVCTAFVPGRILKEKKERKRKRERKKMIESIQTYKADTFEGYE